MGAGVKLSTMYGVELTPFLSMNLRVFTYLNIVMLRERTL